MKRFLLAIVTFFTLSTPSYADHITGGKIFYTYVGQAGGNYQYHVTLWLFRDHFSAGAQLDASAAFGIFDKGTGVLVWNQSVPRTDTFHLHLISPSPCITNPPDVWYEVGRYEFDVSLPASPTGYVIAYQRCCRIAGINNLVIPSNGVGATYTAEIPGNTELANGPINNSANFIGADTVITCANNPINYSFAAVDPDGDQLSYSFCNAFTGGGQGAGTCGTCNSPNPPLAPPYIVVPYQIPFSGSQPLGPGVTINPFTGLITGIAPAAGIYIVTVCVTETRNGVIIATQRKDLQIKVGDCNPLMALLNPKPTTCDGFTVNFQNDAPGNPPGTEYLWTFGEPSTGPLDTSILATPSHTYTTAGTFTVTLKVSLAGGICADSTSFQVNVFPGFFPGFTAAGSCITFPFQFTDTTRTNYGIVDTWRWDFGDLTTLADTSHLQNPQWTYSTPGPKTVTLSVTNSKGCVNTAQITVDVLDKPVITLAFNDTLICRNDVIQLNASGTGTFNWTPPVNIINANTATPTVSPTSNQWYFVHLNDNGCLNDDSVLVRVVNSVTLRANNDTTICQGDAIQLGAISDGLSFSWTPAANLDNPNIINPIAITNNTTTYTVVASIGSCSTTDQMVVTTVPYPLANTGPDQLICHNTSAQLNASHNGISFTWSPTSYLSNPNILNPIATPPRTTAYILTVFDNKGCPKPGRDTIVVTVNPRVRAYAGRDTIVVVGQPLFFNGSGGINYLWSPATGLTSTNIPNPVGVYGMNIDSVRYKLVVSDAAGCADSAYVLVRVYKVKPTIFVPTAFTPNGDGLNDTVYPISVGIKRINYFSIYNRWGQLVFTTTQDRHGWDGTLGGKLQNSGVFVWMVSAVDYLGTPIFLKGTVALIR